MSDDALVLSYYDSVLRQSDVLLLEPPHWINDRLIGFVFEYESRRYDYAAFVAADVAQFIKLSSPNDVTEFMAPLELSSKEVVLIPVNDNDDAERSGGVHWSLLSFIRKTNSFCHYDSLLKLNTEQAQRIADKLRFCLLPDKPPSFQDVDCPQQTNSYDCGMYTICFVYYVLHHVLEGNEKSLKEVVRPETVALKRKELKELISEISLQYCKQ
ncbi:sentrin-specific protease 8-like [Corticium candelabrum]|uniref:sentrin-specific protease 8-like n=1 Tax=Corticium candelabrum TaxID=121492 RepID=UPI002E2540A4|nr:sentrin-specific protease 8-like [Corticium candelabrum]